MKVELTKEWCMNMAKTEAEAGSPEQNIGPTPPKLTSEQLCNIGFAVLRAHNNDRLWRALTYDSGPYDLTTPNLALQELGAAFYAAGYAEAPKTTMKVEVSSDPEMLRRAMAAETEAALLRAALDQKQAEYEDLQRHGNNTAHNLARMQAALQAALQEAATRSAGYLRNAIKAEHLAGDARIGELHDEAERMRDVLRRLWPLIERSMKDYVFTGDKAGEVAADVAALRKSLGA